MCLKLCLLFLFISCPPGLWKKEHFQGISKELNPTPWVGMDILISGVSHISRNCNDFVLARRSELNH